MLLLAIDIQPGVPKTYKLIQEGKVVGEYAYRGTALIELASLIDEYMEAPATDEDYERSFDAYR